MAFPAAEEGEDGNHVSSSSPLQSPPSPQSLQSLQSSFVLSGETVVVEGLAEGERIIKHPGEINGYVQPSVGSDFKF